MKEVFVIDWLLLIINGNRWIHFTRLVLIYQLVFKKRKPWSNMDGSWWRVARQDNYLDYTLIAPQSNEEMRVARRVLSQFSNQPGTLASQNLMTINSNVYIVIDWQTDRFLWLLISWQIPINYIIAIDWIWFILLIGIPIINFIDCVRSGIIDIDTLRFILQCSLLDACLHVALRIIQIELKYCIILSSPIDIIMSVNFFTTNHSSLNWLN